jgi:phospholipid transport system substrate-binding protein
MHVAMYVRNALAHFTFAVVLALAAPAVTSQAQSARPDSARATAHIQKLADQAIATLQREDMDLAAREGVFRDLLRQHFALPLLGRFALGRHWRRISPGQRADYQAVFGAFILKTYSRRLGGYSGERFAVSGTRPAGKKDLMVNTTISPPSGPPIKAGWRVRAMKDGYKIVDIVVAGVSMALTQRQEFDAVVSRRGVAGLIASLRARTDEMTVVASSGN